MIWSIDYRSSLVSSNKQLYIKSAFESCSVIAFITETQKLLRLREVIVMRHDTPLKHFVNEQNDDGAWLSIAVSFRYEDAGSKR